MRSIIFLFLGAVIIFGTISLPFVLSEREKNNPKRVQIAKVIKEEIEELVLAQGRIDSLQIKKIVSTESGLIKALTVREGDTVEAGSVLCLIKAFDLFPEDAPAVDNMLLQGNLEGIEKYLKRTYNKYVEQIEEARISYFAAIEDYRNSKFLYQEGALPEQQLEEAKIRLKKSEFLYYSVRMSLEEKLKKAKVVTPISGVVIENKAEEGSGCEKGRELFTIANMEEICARVQVDELDIGKVKIGQQARIKGDTFAPHFLEGYVKEIGVASSFGREGIPLIEIIVKIDDDKGIKLRIGSSVIAEIVTSKSSGVPIIPTSAVLLAEKGMAVFVIEGGIARLKSIEIGLENENIAEVVKGLRIGEEVVTVGNLDLKGGEKVEIIGR